MLGIVRTALATVLIITAMLLAAGNLSAGSFVCEGNPDYFTKRCVVHPYVVTKRVDGRDLKGHLVGCQFKSYSCVDGLCKDNYNSNQMIPYFIDMNDIKGFCDLLCRNPECPDSGWK